jgi:hypothetical protein
MNWPQRGLLRFGNRGPFITIHYWAFSKTSSLAVMILLTAIPCHISTRPPPWPIVSSSAVFVIEVRVRKPAMGHRSLLLLFGTSSFHRMALIGGHQCGRRRWSRACGRGSRMTVVAIFEAQRSIQGNHSVKGVKAGIDFVSGAT